MNNWNWSEDQLRRWTPRRPSPELRARLFGKPALARDAVRTVSDFSRWLVPAFGCFVLVMGGLSQRFTGEHAFQRETNVLGPAAGSSRFMLAEARVHSEINAVPVKHLHYSFVSNITQPASPGPDFSFTNRLIQ